MTDTPISRIVTVTVPCRYQELPETALCEASITATVEYTYPEAATWEYPGTVGGWSVIGVERGSGCHHNLIMDEFSSAYRSMERRAIHVAQEECDQ